MKFCAAWNPPAVDSVMRKITKCQPCAKRVISDIQHPVTNYRGANKSLARPTSRCSLFDDENILFDASLVIYIYI